MGGLREYQQTKYNLNPNTDEYYTSKSTAVRITAHCEPGCRELACRAHAQSTWIKDVNLTMPMGCHLGGIYLTNVVGAGQYNHK